MYRYYQTSRHKSWQIIPDGPDVLQRARALGASALTVLAVSAPIDEDDPNQTLRHSGPLYFDVDCKDDLLLAIKSTRELVDKLVGLDVPRQLISLYASGGKGFHVFVPTELFRSSSRARKDLPYIYREMALALYVTGLDFSVYSGGKGNCWRVVNKQREDGAYRVSISYDELLAMDEPTYRTIVTNPRPYDTYAQTPEGERAPLLESLFEDSEKRQRVKAERQPNPVADDLLNASFSTTEPGCINLLVDYRTKPGVMFNASAFQLAIFLARTGRSTAAAKELLQRFAKNSRSQTYDSPYTRNNHAEALWKLMQQRSNQNKQFSCGAMRSLVGRDTCSACPLTAQTGNLNGSEFENVLIRPDGYYKAVGEGKDIKLTNYIMTPVSVQMMPDLITGELKRTGCDMEFTRNHEVVDSRFMPEDCWDSRSRYLAATLAMKELVGSAFTGRELDLPLIKQAVFHEQEDTMGEKIIVYGAGIHSLRGRNSRYGRVYVEPNYSITTDGFLETHLLHVDADAAFSAHLGEVDLPEPGDQELDEALLALMKTRTPSPASLLVGWHVACHFKTQLMESFHQFPLMSLWGTSGSGKTTSWRLFSALNGLDHMRSDMFDCSMSTSWAMGYMASSSVSVPVCFDEHNKAQYKSASIATFLQSLLKASYGANRIGKGVVNPNKSSVYGAQMSQLRVTAPCAVISEEPLDQYDAIEQRTVTVGLALRNKSNQALQTLAPLHHRLMELARALMQLSLVSETPEVDKYMRDCINHTNKVMGYSLSFLDRPVYNYAICHLGLGYLLRACNSLDMPKSAAHVAVLQGHLDTFLSEQATQIGDAARHSQINRVMEKFSVLAALTRANEHTTNPVIEGSHYTVKGKWLLFKPAIILQIIERERFDTPIKSLKQFMKLLRCETYFSRENARDNILGRCTAVEMEELAKRGVDVSGFTDI